MKKKEMEMALTIISDGKSLFTSCYVKKKTIIFICFSPILCTNDLLQSVELANAFA